MPIRNFPILVENGQHRAWLPVKITNPELNLHMTVFGLVDTGADKCAIPAKFARSLGHNLRKGTPDRSVGAGGSTKSYWHKTKIDILSLDRDIVYSIPITSVEYVEKLPCVLLGVEKFLDQFILEIDYPKKFFSIKNSKKFYLAP